MVHFDPLWIPESLVYPFHMRNFAWSEKDMDTTNYRNLFEYVKNHKYPPGFSKQSKLILRREARNFKLDPKLESLFYLDKQKNGTTFKRLVIKEDKKARVFEECHSSNFSGHACRDNIHTYIQLYLRTRTISILHCVILVSKWGVSKFTYIQTDRQTDRQTDYYGHT